MVSRPRFDKVLVIQVPSYRLASDAMTPTLSYPSTGFPARFGLIDRSIRGVTWRPDALCTFVTIDSRTVTSYGVCHVLITSWAEMP